MMIDNNTAPYAALVLRIASGALFIAHGLLKVLVFTIPGTVGYFESLGLPGVFAYLTILAELVGGHHEQKQREMGCGADFGAWCTGGVFGVNSCFTGRYLGARW